MLNSYRELGRESCGNYNYSFVTKPRSLGDVFFLQKLRTSLTSVPCDVLVSE